MKIQEIAKELDMAPKMVRRFIRAGKIDAKKDDKNRWNFTGTLPTKESLMEKAPKAEKAPKDEAKEVKTGVKAEAPKDEAKK